jgi:hypothetical protein
MAFVPAPRDRLGVKKRMTWDRRERYSLDFEAPVLSRDHLWGIGAKTLSIMVIRKGQHPCCMEGASYGRSFLFLSGRKLVSEPAMDVFASRPRRKFIKPPSFGHWPISLVLARRWITIRGRLETLVPIISTPKRWLPLVGCYSPPWILVKKKVRLREGVVPLKFTNKCMYKFKCSKCFM